MWASTTAGPTCRTTSKWIGSTTSRAGWQCRADGDSSISAAATSSPWLGFGHTSHNAAATLAQSLCIPFEQSLKSFDDSGSAPRKRLVLIGQASTACDSSLFARSVNLLLANEDKLYPGAMIASLSIPWGEDKSDDDLGGYHLVWTRDMVMRHRAARRRRHSDSAARHDLPGDRPARRRRLLPEFLDRRRSLLDRRQLDEVSFPIILALAAVEGERRWAISIPTSRYCAPAAT